MSFHVPNQFRIRTGRMGSTDVIGQQGAFAVPFKDTPSLMIVANCAHPMTGGWEHVSVSRPNRCPTWAEMCRVKELFWDPEDVVLQIHPAQSEYVNHHPYCLHLWRHAVLSTIEWPQAYLVGPKEKA